MARALLQTVAVAFVTAAVFICRANLAGQVSGAPYRDPEMLVIIRGVPSHPSLADLMDFKAGVAALASVEGLRLAGMTLVTGQQRQVPIARVTDGWLGHMGVAFSAGGGWSPGQRSVVVLAPSLAAQEFGSAQAAIGKVLQARRLAGPAAKIDTESLTVVGVLREHLPLPADEIPAPLEMFVPYVPEEKELEARGPRAVVLIGRLHDRSGFDPAAAQAHEVAIRLAKTHTRNQGTDATLVRLLEAVQEQRR